MKITLLIVATGKYFQFVEQLLQSAEQHFLPGHEKTYVVFTDGGPFAGEDAKYPANPYQSQLHYAQIKHEPWPLSTMLRPKYYADWLRENKGKSDFVFAIDADAKFAGTVGDEILKETVAVRHCAHITTDPEKFPARSHFWKHYFGGGFWGGREKSFYILARGISIEAEQLISTNQIPEFHEETILNNFLNSEHWCNGVTMLNCSYHYPLWHDGNLLPHIAQQWQEANLSFEPKICFLHKDHNQIRN